jgi:hypothetical protein
MVKLRGFGGETEFWGHALVGFILMASIAVAPNGPSHTPPPPC